MEASNWMRPDDWGLLRDAALALVASPTVASCEWTEDDSGWQTGCGRDWQFIDDGPVENRMDYCMGCGRKIVIGESSHE
jgi:hypothetical protein